MGLLGLSHITYAPGFTSDTHPNGPKTFTEDEWIDAFYNSYSYWVLGFAERLIETDSINSGFAILLILYPYFEMLVRYRRGSAGNPQEYVQEGMNRVFDDVFDGVPSMTRGKVTEFLYNHMRCELAHGNLTGKGVALSQDRPELIWWETDHSGSVTGVGVNPQKWVERIRKHFDSYKQELLDSKNVTTRENFLKYARRNFGGSSEAIQF